MSILNKWTIGLLTLALYFTSFYSVLFAQDQAEVEYQESMKPTDNNNVEQSPSINDSYFSPARQNQTDVEFRESMKPTDNNNSVQQQSPKSANGSVSPAGEDKAEEEYKEGFKPTDEAAIDEKANGGKATSLLHSLKPKVEAHGFVKMDVLNQNRIPFFDTIYAILPGIPLDSDRPRHHSQTLWDARHSQFWFDSSFEYCSWKFKGWIGIEFSSFDGSAVVVNNRHCILHLAYLRGDYKDRWFFIVGQYWSMFVSDIASPFDFFIGDTEGPASQINARQPQVRVGYQMPVGNNLGVFRLVFAAEKQSVFHFPFEEDAIGSDQGLGFIWPLFCAKLEWKLWEPLQMEFIAGATQDRIIRFSGKALEKSAWGYKFCIQSTLWKATFFASYLYLNGLNRLPTIPYVDVVTVHGRLETTRSKGGTVGVAIPIYEKCGNKTYLTIMAGWLWAKEIPHSAFSGDVKQKYQTWQIDIGHKFWENFIIAAEFKRFNVRAFNGKRGSMNQIGGSMFYFF